VLGYTGSKRAPTAPDVPTIAEAGLPGFEVASWYGLFVPARTPDHTTRTMNAAAVTALTDPSVVGRLDQLGYAAAASTREELAAHLKADIDKWSRVIRDAGISI
jgi:tripartite-type tricarboxylate transporter receptor subunit TctC